VARSYFRCANPNITSSAPAEQQPIPTRRNVGTFLDVVAVALKLPTRNTSSLCLNCTLLRKRNTSPSTSSAPPLNVSFFILGPAIPLRSNRFGFGRVLAWIGRCNDDAYRLLVEAFEAAMALQVLKVAAD